ncbi:MAG TPA: trigger factor [Candidatus Bathyarchaeia archaeon]|nr:trigger factor [Candidatus Bathyarchaeia archaeon]
MISALSKQPDKTCDLTITIPKKRVLKAYDKTVEKLAKEVEIKGFRKGKAPKKIVEKRLDKSRVYEEVLKELITEVYLEAVKEHQLKPIVNPQIQVTSMEEGKDWVIKAVTCELPEVNLGKYKEVARKVLAVEKIWVPGKEEPDQEGQDPSQPQKREKQLAKILEALQKSVKLKIPPLLIENEVSRMLSRLLDQTSRLGLSVEQYLASAGKTSDQIREEYQKTAADQIGMELILSAIADKEGIKVKDEEVEAMIKAVPDEKARQSADTPAQRAYIRQLLRKRAVIDNLLKL